MTYVNLRNKIRELNNALDTVGSTEGYLRINWQIQELQRENPEEYEKAINEIYGSNHG